MALAWPLSRRSDGARLEPPASCEGDDTGVYELVYEVLAGWRSARCRGRNTSVGERGGDRPAQAWQHVLGEPRIAPLPGHGTPRWMRQRKKVRQVPTKVTHAFGHRAAPQHVSEG